VSHADDAEALKKDLLNMAKTTLSSKVVSQDKEHFAKLCVDAVLRLKGSVNLDLIQIIKKPGGRMEDSYLDDGSPSFSSVFSRSELIDPPPPPPIGLFVSRIHLAKEDWHQPAQEDGECQDSDCQYRHGY